jgi:hypothetical protein
LSISASKSPLLTFCPSLKSMRMIWPLICVLTVTVASGVTVPSAL